MPIHSAQVAVNDTGATEVLPEDRNRRWYVVQNRTGAGVFIGGETLASPDGLYLSSDDASNGASDRFYVGQGHENDKTPCHAVWALCDGSSGPLQVTWATEDATD